MASSSFKSPSSTGGQGQGQGFADPTFRTNSRSAAEAYQAGRPGYADALISAVLKHHTSTGGALTALLDVGCGPGTATRSLSPHFTRAFACDPSAAMIATASALPSTTRSGQAVSFAVGAAEELDQTLFPPASTPLAAGSVDLITAAMAAHWFDLPPFYAAAERLLAPRGTIALWTASSYYCDPRSTPNAHAVQEILFNLERNILAPYEMPGNRLSRDMYERLPLPWTVEPAVAGLEETSLLRLEWNRDGRIEEKEEEEEEEEGERGGFLLAEPRRSLDGWAEACGTASMVVRWREANAEKVGSGQLVDCVEQTVRRLREAMGGREWLEGGPAMVCLLIKKRG